QGAPLPVTLGDNTGLLAIVLLATMVARQHHQLEQALHAREEFLALVSHDLRSPLGTIRGYAQLARRRTPAVVHELATIETVADRMRRTLDDLLDTAHLQAGQQLALKCAATDLVALVQRAVADRRITAPDCSFSLSGVAAPLIGYW